MARADYDHWNEEADLVWWEEEGRHQIEDSIQDEHDFYSAADAYAEELTELSDEELIEAANCHENTAAMQKCIVWELRYRKLDVNFRVNVR